MEIEICLNKPRLPETKKAEANPIQNLIDQYARDRKSSNKKNPAQRIERDVEGESSFFLITRDSKTKQEKREKFDIELINDPESPTLPKAYQVLAETFKPEEMDSLEIIQEKMNGLRYGQDMGGKAFALAIKNANEEVQATLIGGLMPLYKEQGEATNDRVLIIFYMAIKDKMKKFGFGREAMIDAYKYAQEEVKKEKSNFVGAAGECTYTSRDYWEKFGWRRVYVKNENGPIEEIPYAQPPMAYDLKTGEPAEGAGVAPEHLMVQFTDKVKKSNDELKRNVLRVVQTFYKCNNYVARDAFTDAAGGEKESAERAFQKHLSAIKPFEDKYIVDLNKGDVALYSQENLKELSSEGIPIIQFYTCDEDREIGEGRYKEFEPTQNM